VYFVQISISAVIRSITGNEGPALLDVSAREYHGLEQPPGRSDDGMPVAFRPDGEREFQASEISHRRGGKGLHVSFSFFCGRRVGVAR
jgi:hypothetical protein